MAAQTSIHCTDSAETLYPRQPGQPAVGPSLHLVWTHVHAQFWAAGSCSLRRPRQADLSKKQKEPQMLQNLRCERACTIPSRPSLGTASARALIYNAVLPRPSSAMHLSALEHLHLPSMPKGPHRQPGRGSAGRVRTQRAAQAACSPRARASFARGR